MLDFRKKRILVVAAHPDDEILGVGATMARLVHEFESTIHVVILGEGLTSRTEVRDTNHYETELEEHQKDIVKAQKKIGYHSLKTYPLPDNRFDQLDLLDVVKVVESEIRSFSPDIIFTHHGGDTNVDHRVTFNAVITACRPLPGQKLQAILSFEVPSSTEYQAFNAPMPFLPNFFIAFNDQHLKRKLDAMECYQYEKREFPHPRSGQALETIARRWGVNCGHQAAEAFVLVRSIFA